jgi:Zn-dependent protease with chaperone function
MHQVSDVDATWSARTAVGRFGRFVERCSVGRPEHFRSAWDWVRAGAARQMVPALVALALAWTGLWLLPVAAVGFVAVAVVTGVVATFVGGGGVALLALLFVALSTVVAGIAVVLAPLQQIPALVTSLIGGTIVSLLVFVLMLASESMALRGRGCRRLSRRESARLIPLVETAAGRLHLTSLPIVLIADDGERNAYACARHIVVSRTLYDELADGPLAGVLAHELHHWAMGDALGLRLVFACGLPLTLMYNAGTWLTQFKSVLTILGWFFLWPSLVLTRFVIQPLVADRSRQCEFEADAAAMRAGYGPALTEALIYLGDFESGRSGWEQVLAATHPPRELRLEALEGEEPAKRSA